MTGPSISREKFHVKGFSKGTCEVGDKLRSDVVRDSMLGENMNDK